MWGFSIQSNHWFGPQLQCLINPNSNSDSVCIKLHGTKRPFHIAGRLGFVHNHLELGVAIKWVRITRTLICFQEKIQKLGVGEDSFVQGDGGLDE